MSEDMRGMKAKKGKERWKRSLIKMLPDLKEQEKV